MYWELVQSSARFPQGAITGAANVLIGTAATPPAAANLEAMQTNAAGAIPGATILKAANGLQTAENCHKGRRNFGHHGKAAGFTPLITLADSNWGKTWATANHRPTADANDLDLGYEGNIDTLYSRAEKEVREYVGKLPDGNPQEKLSAAAKTFNVPVTINGNLTVNGKCSGCGERRAAQLELRTVPGRDGRFRLLGRKRQFLRRICARRRLAVRGNIGSATIWMRRMPVRPGQRSDGSHYCVEGRNQREEHSSPSFGRGRFRREQLVFGGDFKFRRR